MLVALLTQSLPPDTVPDPDGMVTVLVVEKYSTSPDGSDLYNAHQMMLF